MAKTTEICLNDAFCVARLLCLHKLHVVTLVAMVVSFVCMRFCAWLRRKLLHLMRRGSEFLGGGIKIFILSKIATGGGG